ncbi:MAG: TVP38/TMEM64 family protein [Clostridia bacterium]|nr:TVP38/TMEM64 family protein [Clostridia bacterium]
MDKETKINLLKFIIPVVVILLIALIVHETGISKQFEVDNLKKFLNSFGPWAPLIFILLCTLRPLLLLPVGIFSILGGILFGYALGTIYTSIGVTLGSFIAYWLAQKLGKDFVDKILKGKLKTFNDNSEKHGFKIILLMRVIPVLPVDVISYGAGLSNITFKDFAFGTLVGILPGTFVYSYFGSSIRNFSKSKLILAIAMIGLLVAVPIIFKDYVKKYI